MGQTSAAVEPLVLAEERKRAVCFGEALRAISVYVSEDIASPASSQVLMVFEAAFRHMKRTRGRFGPQDFTLYAMSRLLLQMKDDGDIKRLRLGAARYLLDVYSHLSFEFRVLAVEARKLLNSVPDQDKLSPILATTEQQVFSTVRSNLHSVEKRQFQQRQSNRHQRRQVHALNKEAAPASKDGTDNASSFVHERKTPTKREYGGTLIALAYVLFLVFVIWVIASLFSGTAPSGL